MSKLTTAIVPIALATAILGAPSAGSSQGKPQAPPPSGQGQAAASPLVYKPPLRGAPRGRIGGGTRGIGSQSIVLSVMAPDHPGLTTSEQPSLFWFISASPTYPVELTLVDPRADEPLLETKIHGPIEAGLQRFRLSSHGVRLEAGVAYRWYVAVVVDPASRSKDILAGGVIERVEPSADVRQRLAQAPREQLPAVFAEAGFWYDALSASSDLVEKMPDDPRPRQLRAALLTQVGLSPVGAQ